jgi:hypothetical protein
MIKARPHSADVAPGPMLAPPPTGSLGALPDGAEAFEFLNPNLLQEAAAVVVRALRLRRRLLVAPRRTDLSGPLVHRRRKGRAMHPTLASAAL